MTKDEISFERWLDIFKYFYREITLIEEITARSLYNMGYDAAEHGLTLSEQKQKKWIADERIRRKLKRSKERKNAKSVS